MRPFSMSDFLGWTFYLVIIGALFLIPLLISGCLHTLAK